MPLAFCFCLGYTVTMFKIWLKTTVGKDRKIQKSEMIFYDGKYDGGGVDG